MNPTPVFLLEVQLPSAHADSLAEWFDASFGCPVTITERPESTHAWVQAIFPADLEAHLARQALPSDLGIQGSIIRASAPRDWATFWKHHFTPRNIGRKLQIRPIWDPGDPAATDRIPLLLDPGLSFGTGEHFTTRFCLEALERNLPHPPAASLLDIGTGSGIIAIAARKLGIPTVHATDNDPTAVEHARANLALNHCPDVTLDVHDILAHPIPGTYDIVCANILANVLTQAAAPIARATRRLLLLSGIREHECDAIAAAYHDHGLTETGRDGDGEWAGLTLVRFAKPSSS